MRHTNQSERNRPLQRCRYFIGCFLICLLNIACVERAKLSETEWLKHVTSLKLTGDLLDLSLAQKGWVHHSLNQNEEALKDWERSQHPLANYGMWLLSYQAVNHGDLGHLDDLLRRSDLALLTREDWLAAVIWIGLLGIEQQQEWSEDQAKQIKMMIDRAAQIWSDQTTSPQAVACQPKQQEREDDQLYQPHSLYECETSCPRSELKRSLYLDKAWQVNSLHARSILSSGLQIPITHLPKPRGEVISLEPVEASCRQGISNPVDGSQSLKIFIESEEPPRLIWGARLPDIPPTLIRDLPQKVHDALVSPLIAAKEDRLSPLLSSPDESFTQRLQLWRHWPPQERSIVDERDPDSLLSWRSGLHALILTGELQSAVKLIIQKINDIHGVIPRDWIPLLPAETTNIAHELTGSIQTGSELSEFLWELADTLCALGHPIEKVIPPLIVFDPSASRSLDWLITHPEWAPWGELEGALQSPEAKINKYLASPWPELKEGKLGQLLDRQNLYLLANGEGIRLVTEVIRVNSRAGVEDLGELRLPDEARLIDLYHRKPYGGKRAPIQILETGGYSFSDLQVNDWIIARYLEPITSERRSGGVLLPPISLVESDRAVFSRELNVLIEQSEKQIHFDLPQFKLPVEEIKHEVKERDRLWHLSLSLLKALPYVEEPASLPNNSSDPTLRIGHGPEPVRERETILPILSRLMKLDLGLCFEAKRYLSLERAPTIRELLGLTLRRVQRPTPLLEAPNPSEALRRGVGSVELTLAALLSDCGYPAEIWLARSPAAVHAPLFEHLDEYEWPLVKVGEIWIDPEMGENMLGLVRTELKSAAVTQIWPPHRDDPQRAKETVSSFEMGHLPWMIDLEPSDQSIDHPRMSYTHQMQADLRVDRDRPLGVLSARAVIGRVTHVFTGSEGVVLMEKLSSASEKAISGWIERQWGTWWGPAEVTSLTYEQTTRGTHLSYQILIWVRPESTLSPSPQIWGTRFGSLSTRHRDLVLPFVRQRIQLHLEGMSISSLSGELSILLPSKRASVSTEVQPWLSLEASGSPQQIKGHYQYQARPFTASKAGGIDLDIEWTLSGGLLSVKNYKEWRRFSREVEAQEHLSIVLND